ncbi:ATP-dependent endonuclease [Alteribacillus sp. HJP-4]|uniref:ATP-dependent nuclease n=1 Tax=Alteribacillus sp. HJP-4 TaxID=2775394 RepID=UPI0035CD0E00
MSLERIIVENYKHFQDLDLYINNDMNVLIGNNGTGKSSILEMVHLALTGYLRNRPIYHEINPYLFNIETTKKFLEEAIRYRNEEIETVTPPTIMIEIFFSEDEDQDLNKFRGSENSETKDHLGFTFKIKFDERYEEEYLEYLKNKEISFIPTEFYMVEWKSFGDHNITPRSIPFKSYFIDSSDSSFSQLPQKHFMGIIDNTLEKKQRANLSVLYREYKEQFAKHEEVRKLNKSLNEKKQGSFSEEDSSEIALSLDVSRKTSWETAVNAYIDNIPFENIGTGNQNMLKSVYAVQNRREKQTILLMEEPENHLSFANMRKLLNRLMELSDDQQIFVSTHESYILNKLHLNKLILLSKWGNSSFNELSKDTVRYFQKLPSYNTLRFILSSKVILVEGPADELIVTKCYMDQHNGKTPLDDGVDVFSVNGLSFKRFLDIAKLIEINTCVVTDNDGNFQQNIENKYMEYRMPYIKICADTNNNLNTLEPQLLFKGNNFERLKKVLKKPDITIEEMNKFMEGNKTDWALEVFLDQEENFEYPRYILDAVH